MKILVLFIYIFIKKYIYKLKFIYNICNLLHFYLIFQINYSIILFIILFLTHLFFKYFLKKQKLKEIYLFYPLFPIFLKNSKNKSRKIYLGLTILLGKLFLPKPWAEF